MRFFGPLSSLFDLITFAFLYYFLCPALTGGLFPELSPAMQEQYAILFHTGWFLESLWTQVLILHMLRTKHLPFAQSSASGIVWLVTSAGLLLLTAVVYLPAASWLGLAPLPLYYFAFLAAVVLAYMLLVTLANLLGALGFGANLVTYFFKYEIAADFLGENSLIGALGLSTIYYIMTGLPGFLGMLAADKIKKWCHGYVNALIVMQACNILARIAAYFIGFEGKNLWFAMAVIGLGGIPLGAAAIAQTAIFCDSIDYMEWKTGKRTEGITFSMQTSFTKISSGITAGLATLALHLLHYKPIEGASTYLGTQSAAFDRWIWPLVILTPAIASLLYIVPLLFIRYTPAQRAQVEQELKARRAATDSQNT